MSVKVTDLSPQFLKAYRDASRLATDAAAALYEGNVKKRFMQGYYTTQAFRSTAQIVQHIQRDAPVYMGGGWVSQVGIPDGIPATPKKVPKGWKPPKKPTTVGMIALGWEVGHNNIFVGRKFKVKSVRMQVPIFKPVMLDSLKAMIDTYNRVLNRYMERGRPVR
jgi:hypothetical protein